MHLGDDESCRPGESTGGTFLFPSRRPFHSGGLSIRVAFPSGSHLTKFQGKSAAAGTSAETESEISIDQESTASNFALAYGHRYYAAGNIFLSFDETEQRRLDSLHRLLRLCLDGELTAVSRQPVSIQRRSVQNAQ